MACLRDLTTVTYNTRSHSDALEEFNRALGIGETEVSVKTEDSKLAAALDQLERTLGKNYIRPVRDGDIRLPDKEVVAWSAMASEDMRRIAELAIGERMMPTEALRFTNKAIDEKTKLGDLIRLAVTGPLEVNIAGFVNLTFNRKHFVDEVPKMQKLLRIK